MLKTFALVTQSVTELKSKITYMCTYLYLSSTGTCIDPVHVPVSVQVTGYYTYLYRSRSQGGTRTCIAPGHRVVHVPVSLQYTYLYRSSTRTSIDPGHRVVHVPVSLQVTGYYTYLYRSRSQGTTRTCIAPGRSCCRRGRRAVSYTHLRAHETA